MHITLNTLARRTNAHALLRSQIETSPRPPKIIFSYFHDINVVTTNIRQNWEKMKARFPDYNWQLFDIESGRAFLKAHFDSKVVHAYDSLIPHSYKSDLFRFGYMYIHGGIYLDIKYETVGDFLFDVFNTSLIVSEPSGIQTCLLVSPPNNILYKLCVDKIVANVENTEYGAGPCWPTGPALLSDIYFKHPQVQDKTIHTSLRWTNPRLQEITYNGTLILRQLESYRQDLENTPGSQAHYNNYFWERKVYKQWRTKLVFICHSQETADICLQKSPDAAVLFVGPNPVTPNDRIIIVRDLPDNIEQEKKLLTFTAWYAVAKNNLFADYDYICLFEWDVNLNAIFSLGGATTDVVVYFHCNRMFFPMDINMNVLQQFLQKKGLGPYNTNEDWMNTSNHCLNRKTLTDFVNWYYPDCLDIIKTTDPAGLPWYHERLFWCFVKYTGISYELKGGIEHCYQNSHNLFTAK